MSVAAAGVCNVLRGSNRYGTHGISGRCGDDARGRCGSSGCGCASCGGSFDDVDRRCGGTGVPGLAAEDTAAPSGGASAEPCHLLLISDVTFCIKTLRHLNKALLLLLFSFEC